MSVLWTEGAIADLEKIRSFVSRSSPDYFNSLADRIISRADILEGIPLAGAEVPEYQQVSIRELFERPYRILYRLVTGGVEIMAVYDARYRLPRTPPG